MSCARVPGQERPGSSGRLAKPGDPNEADRCAVTLQLGREPRGGWQVVRRCACGLPQVIETAPRLGDGTPFPTLWWLTCRALCSAVGRLEASGWMAAVNVALASAPDRRAELERAVQRYVEARDACEVLPGKGHPGGGPDRVKCLHAHVAQELAGSENPVGRAVLDELRWSDPAHPCVPIPPGVPAGPADPTGAAGHRAAVDPVQAHEAGGAVEREPSAAHGGATADPSGAQP